MPSSDSLVWSCCLEQVLFVPFPRPSGQTLLRQSGRSCPEKCESATGTFFLTRSMSHCCQLLVGFPALGRLSSSKGKKKFFKNRKILHSYKCITFGEKFSKVKIYKVLFSAQIYLLIQWIRDILNSLLSGPNNFQDSPFSYFTDFSASCMATVFKRNFYKEIYLLCSD